MKLYRGKKRLAMRMMPPRHRRLMTWALSIKPGDYIATCEGCNRQVAKIEFQEWRNEGWWVRGKPNKTWYLGEVIFEDTHGSLHYCPGGGCAYPAETPQQVTEYFNKWAFDKGSEEFLLHWNGKDPEKIKAGLENLKKFQEALQTGKPIIDQYGELLPEFDRWSYHASNDQN